MTKFKLAAASSAISVTAAIVAFVAAGGSELANGVYII